MYPIYSTLIEKLGTTDIDNREDLAFELNIDKKLITFDADSEMFLISLTKEEFLKG